MSRVKKDIVNELHKPARRNFRRRRVIIKGLDDLWQADLADFKLYSRENRGYKYILVVIDAFSNVAKASIAERAVRTLKERLYKEFSLLGNYNWRSILDDITKRYNHTIHRTIGMKPVDVTLVKESALLSSAYNRPKIAGKRKFAVNDVVRISYTPNWSTELFKIGKVQLTNPATYLLNDMNGDPILGSFYEQELQKAKHEDAYLVEKVLRRKGNKVYVKWLGFPKTHNSWIDKTNAL
ncbi:hypothetical protein QE152_g30661 [Popillia japonica]|uniref:Chromo domain-containing protein n=1 Tax=Popillia japonica TaxID=7064 RepID=A0AAW1JE48_POPJA